MKNKFIALVLAIVIANTAMAGNIIYRDTDYPSGTTWTSPNGQFELVYKDGYLNEWQITPDGRIELFQFPDNGAANPTAKLSLRTVYEDYNPWFGTGDIRYDVYIFNIGDVRWDFKGQNGLGNPSLYNYTPGYEGRAGYVVLTNDGSFFITTEASQPNAVWTSTTKPEQLYGLQNYHANIVEGNNLIFPKPFKDEYDTKFFAAGKITFKDNCKISQALVPVAFEALRFSEMLPGFETAVTGLGAVIIAPIPIENSVATSASRTNVPKEDEPIPKPSKFAIFPNPTNGVLNITLDSDDVIKTITLFDNAGKVVAVYKNTLHFDIGSRANGMYIYKVETEKSTYTGKIVKE